MSTRAVEPALDAVLRVCDGRANGLFGGGPADALVYRHGVTGETVEVERADDQSARRCRRLAQDVWRASETTDARHARLEQRPDYVAAVQAYLACGCGGEGRDVRALRKMQTAANDPRS